MRIPWLRKKPLLVEWDLTGSNETGYGAVVSLIWVVATVLAIALPEFETGSDPTLIPFGALFAPLGAAVLTGLAGVVAAGIFGRPQHDR